MVKRKAKKSRLQSTTVIIFSPLMTSRKGGLLRVSSRYGDLRQKGNMTICFMRTGQQVQAREAGVARASVLARSWTWGISFAAEGP